MRTRMERKSDGRTRKENKVEEEEENLIRDEEVFFKAKSFFLTFLVFKSCYSSNNHRLSLGSFCAAFLIKICCSRLLFDLSLLLS